eukprot:gene1379-804_t
MCSLLRFFSFFLVVLIPVQKKPKSRHVSSLAASPSLQCTSKRKKSTFLVLKQTLTSPRSNLCGDPSTPPHPILLFLGIVLRFTMDTRATARLISSTSSSMCR